MPDSNSTIVEVFTINDGHRARQESPPMKDDPVAGCANTPVDLLKKCLVQGKNLSRHKGLTRVKGKMAKYVTGLISIFGNQFGLWQDLGNVAEDAGAFFVSQNLGKDFYRNSEFW